MTDRPPLSAADSPVSGDEQGARAAISPAAPAAEPAEADLFGLELDQFADQAIKPPQRRGPGRPAGSPNRATTKVKELLLARGYRDPIEMLAAVVSMDLGDLKALGIKGPEALSLQIRAAAELIPYFHQALPKQVEVRGDPERPLFVIRRASPANDEADQRVIDVTPNASHGATSHERSQVTDNAALFAGGEHD